MFIKNGLFINCGVTGIFEEKKCNRKKHKLCKKSRNYQHLNKIDIFVNVNGNVNKFMV